MSDSVDSEASKKDALIPPAADRTRGDTPALLTEGALLRLEEGLRAARLGQSLPFPAPASQAPPPLSVPPQQPATMQRPEHATLPGQSSPSTVAPSQETPPSPTQRGEQETPSPPMQEGQCFSEPDAASSQPEAAVLGTAEKRTADWLIVSTRIDTISENPPLAPRADQLKIRTEEPIPSSSGRRRKMGLLLSAFLIVGAAALGAIAAGLIFVLAVTFFFR
jgi:hypothetical protein